jgi:UDP-glucose 4-epimerase
MSDPRADFEASVTVTADLLEQIRQHAPGCRTVCVSSAAVYGNPDRLPIGEDAPIRPISAYGFHRRMCEELCEEYARLFDLPVTIARVFSAYGPGLRRQIVWDICRRALSEPAVELRGTGNESRDFIHGSDVGRALAVLVGQAPSRGEAYNIASGTETRIRDLADLILGNLDDPPPVQFSGIQNPGNPSNWRAAITPITELGFSPATSLERGIANYVEWCRAQLTA